MAFQFPDPAVATTITNDATGITYQWQADPGKWVIAVETLDTYCVVQQTSTLETNADSQIEFYTDFEITGDKILTTTVNEQVDYIVSYEGIEERVSNLSDVEKQKIGFIEISKGKYISQSAPDASLVGGVTLKQVITMFDIASDEYECISPERILFGPTGTVAPQGTISQPLECCHKFIASPKVQSPDRPPIISDTEPTEHPNFPDEPLQEGDFWIDNHDGRAFTPMYYWTGTEWEELEHDENWDEELKKHTCAQFYKKVASYGDVQSKEGHFCSSYDFGNSRVKWWTSPSGKNFYNNGDSIWVNDQGPYVLEELTDSGQWTTFFLPGSIQPANGTIVKFSKIPTLCDTSFNDDRYVQKAGDTMTGTLVMQDANIDFIIPGESLKDTNGDPILEDDGKGNMVEQWDDSIDRFSHIESLPPMILRSDGTYGGDTSAPFGIRVEIDDGNTHRNRFVVGNRNGDAVTITGGTGPNVQFGSGFGGNQNPPNGEIHWENGEEGGVKITGIPTPTFENPDSSLAVNKRYVDARDELLRQDIIELEEEINAIAPSLEYGQWEWEQPTSNLRAPDKGTFYLLDELGQLTTEYKDTKILVINNYEYDDPTDSDPVDIHTWTDANPGELIQLFDAADPDFMLGKIIAVTPASESTSNGLLEYVRIEIDLIQSSGVPNDNPDPATGKFLTRVNVFKEPSGGTASDFVLKNGDEMTGELNISTEQPDGNANYSAPSIKDKHLRLTTTNTRDGVSRHAYLFQPGYSEDLMSSRHFICGSNVYSKGSFLGYSSTGGTDFSTFSPRVVLASTSGGLYWSGTGTSNRRVYLVSNAGYLFHNGKYAAKWDSDGFHAYYQDSLRFTAGSSGTTFEQPIFLHKSNCRLKAQNSSGNSSSGTYGTAGQVLTSQGAAPPRWKDAPMPTYTITKSNGNYYVQ